MRRIATLLAPAALALALVVPAPAAAAETPLPQLPAQVCQVQNTELPSKASVLVGPHVPKAPVSPQTVQAPDSPQFCAGT